MQTRTLLGVYLPNRSLFLAMSAGIFFVALYLLSVAALSSYQDSRALHSDSARQGGNVVRLAGKVGER